MPGLLPVEVIIGDDGRATGVKVIRTDWSSGKMEIVEGSETELECSLLVSAIGQRGDLTGFEELDGGRGLIDADGFYRVKDHPDLFVGGDIIRPHLLTTAIGQASIAAEGINKFLEGTDPSKNGQRWMYITSACWINYGKLTTRRANTRMIRTAAPIHQILRSITLKIAHLSKLYLRMSYFLVISNMKKETNVRKAPLQPTRTGLFRRTH